MTTVHVTRWLAAWSLFGVFLFAGCGGAGNGPVRYELSGNATYQGRPIRGGRILFAPDTNQGNKGPGSVADITHGEFRTRRGKGTVGGPHVVTIYGEDGTMATEEHDNALFPPYKTHLDLPKEDATRDFDVPAAAKP